MVVTVLNRCLCATVLVKSQERMVRLKPIDGTEKLHFKKKSNINFDTVKATRAMSDMSNM